MVIDIALVKHPHWDKLYLFRAPLCSRLKEGDEVLVDTKFGKSPATVKSMAYGVSVNSDVYKFILKTTGATHPLKRVLGVYEDLDYSYEDSRAEEDLSGLFASIPEGFTN